MKLYTADIQVDSADNVVSPVRVTIETKPGTGDRMIFKSNRKTVIIVDENDSPFVGLQPHKVLSEGRGGITPAARERKLVRPKVTLKIKPKGVVPTKRYKILCGRMEGDRFLVWGGGGVSTPGIPC